MKSRICNMYRSKREGEPAKEKEWPRKQKENRGHGSQQAESFKRRVGSAASTDTERLKDEGRKVATYNQALD